MELPMRDYLDELDALMGDTSIRSDPPGSGGALAFRMLVAVTDDDRAVATVQVARALKQFRNATPHVLYVIEVSSSVPEAAWVTVDLEEELRNADQREAMEARMRTVLRLDTADAAQWPFSIEVGNVATIVASQARSRGAELIVMGLNQHTTVSRTIGRDTVQQVMALADVPVLAVRDSLAGLPRRVVAAVDFSRASMRAAAFARRLMADEGDLHVVFVDPGVGEFESEGTDGVRLIRSIGVSTALRDLRDVLERDGNVSVHTTVLQNSNPSAEIIRYCEELGPDLVTIGSQRRRLLERMFLGSTAKAVAATGKWSMLVAPPLRAP